MTTVEDMFWLPKQNLTALQFRLTEYPAALRNWVYRESRFYGLPDQLFAAMEPEENSDGYEVFCGAVSQTALDALLKTIEDLTEPL